MTLQFDLQPEIYGTVQPEPETLTVVVTGPTNRPGQVNVFIANNETYEDRVRVLVKVGEAVMNDSQYLLYDTEIIAGHTVILSNIFVNEGDQIIVWSLQGATAFTVSGTAFVYS